LEKLQKANTKRAKISVFLYIINAYAKIERIGLTLLI